MKNFVSNNKGVRVRPNKNSHTWMFNPNLTKEYKGNITQASEPIVEVVVIEQDNSFFSFELYVDKLTNNLIDCIAAIYVSMQIAEEPFEIADTDYVAFFGKKEKVLFAEIKDAVELKINEFKITKDK